MNANQLVNMVMRIVMRKLIHRGVDAGIKRMSAGRGPSGDPAAERKQKTDGREMVNRSKQAMRLGRRIGRF